MIPLLVFLLGCLGIYLGTIEAAFSALMRLSLRLLAERSDRPDALAAYLDDPILLFAPVRLLLGLVTVAATTLLCLAIGFDGPSRVGLALVSAAAFVAVFELLLPMPIVGRDPEGVLELLLPTFSPIARALGPLMQWTTRLLPAGKQAQPAPVPAEAIEASGEAPQTTVQEGLIADNGIMVGEERRLL